MDDYIDDYIEPVYCPELGAMCDTTLDCMNCPYRNQELNVTIGECY